MSAELKLREMGLTGGAQHLGKRNLIRSIMRHDDGFTHELAIPWNLDVPGIISQVLILLLLISSGYPHRPSVISCFVNLLEPSRKQVALIPLCSATPIF